jgi:hypothetical protein
MVQDESVATATHRSSLNRIGIGGSTQYNTSMHLDAACTMPCFVTC